MRYALVAAIAACALLPGTSVAQQNEGITIEGRQSTVNKWKQNISRDLEQGLRQPLGAQREIPSGAVSVAFQCSEDGKPVGIAVIQKSGSRRLDRLAVRAVTRIRSLHPLPDGITAGRPFQANIAVAGSQDEMTRMLAAFRRNQPALQTAAITIDVGVGDAG